MIEAAAQLLLTYLLHSSLLLGLVWLLDARGLLTRWGMAEPAWRAALLGAWLSSALALTWPTVSMDAAPAPSAAPTTTAPLATPAVATLVAAPPVTSQTAGQTTSQTSGQTAPDWPLLLAALTALWLGVALLALLRLLAGALRLTLHSLRLPPWPDAALQRQAARLGAPRLRPQLRVSPAASPWAWGSVVGLPAWAARDLDRAQQEAVLRHELAHLLRRDPAWRLLTRAAALLGWLQPLNRVALRRLDWLMELDCDRWAAQGDGEQRQALAQGLLRCAEQLRSHHPPRLAAAMLHRPSPLLARMRLLLEPPPMSSSPLRHARWYLAGSLLLAVIALPAALLPAGQPLRDALPEAGERISSWLSPALTRLDLGGANTTRIRSVGPDHEQLLRWQGRAQFSAAEDDVLAVDGPLLFRERRDGRLREWSVKPDADGRLQREYRINGVAQAAPDAEAKRWIASMIQLAIESTLSPTRRAQRLFEREGFAGLQRFLSTAQGDHQRRQRIEAVIQVLPEPARPADFATQLLAVSAGMDASFERRHALQAIAERLSLSEAQWQQLLQQAARVGSDFELAELLQALAPRLPASPAVIEAWRGAVATIESDFEQRRALESQLRRAAVPADWLLPVLAAGEGIDAGFEQRQLLERLVAALPADAPPALLAQLAGASTRIGSDFERREALLSLLRREPREPAVLQAVLDAAAGISAGFERLQLLKASAPLLPADGSLDARYRQLARGLSAHERGEAEQALDR